MFREFWNPVVKVLRPSTLATVLLVLLWDMDQSEVIWALWQVKYEYTVEKTVELENGDLSWTPSG